MQCHLLAKTGSFRPHLHALAGRSFGHVATPAKVERHARLLQLVQERQLTEALGRPVRICRRTDDSIVPLRAHELARAEEMADVFTQVCVSANQPLQRSKVPVGVTVFKFDGHLWDLAQFANNRHGVHPGGVGIDAARAARTAEPPPRAARRRPQAPGAVDRHFGVGGGADPTPKGASQHGSTRHVPSAPGLRPDRARCRDHHRRSTFNA